jgi:hypothetical protein
VAGDSFPLVEDNTEHRVEITLMPVRGSTSPGGPRAAKMVEKPPGR